VILFDDLIATGGTAIASVDLIEKIGGNVLEFIFIAEIAALKGCEKLKCSSYSVLKY